jgi:hypothetical protein
MKKIIIQPIMKVSVFLLLLLSSAAIFGQPANPSSILVKHDTTILEASECEWIIKSLVKNEPSLTAEIGKSIPLVILQAIRSGRLKAVDRETNQPIPGKEIFTWRMPTDTVAQYDDSGNIMKYVAVQAERSSADFTRLRIYQDWYFDIPTGKFQPVIKWVELLENVHTGSGIFIGYRSFCRIYY